jgi:licheninase
MTAYVDGAEWYSTTDTSHFPPRPMNMTMQLDRFGDADGPTAMQMDWARQWALPESEPATLSLAPGDPATGQPELFPDRVPRVLGGG